jgi:hypothetical protein
MKNASIAITIILLIMILLSGCLDLDTGNEKNMGPEEAIRDYNEKLSRGDYFEAYSYLLYNNGTFVSEIEWDIEEMVDTAVINYGRNGEYIDVRINWIKVTHKEEVNTGIGEITRYWVTANGTFEYPIGSWNFESERLVIHFKEMDRWGFASYDEVSFAKYPITKMIRTSLISDETGSILKLENRGGNNLKWKKIQILVDDLPIASKDTGFSDFTWQDGYSIKEINTDEGETQYIRYLHDGGGNLIRFEPGSRHKVTMIRSEDGFKFWESDLQVLSV